MFKKFLLFIALLAVLPVYAGPLEDAMASSDKVFLYLYTPQCGACKQFNSNYMEYARKYGSKCKFVKVNASTQYGAKIAMSIGLKYVPWVVLIDTENKTRKQLRWECLSQPVCAKRTIESFIAD